MVNKKDLGYHLVEGAFIGPEQLQAAQETARRTGRKLAEVVVAQGLVMPETLATVMGFYYSVPVIDLETHTIQPAALALIPEKVAQENSALPLTVNGDVLTLAMVDPSDSALIDALSALSRKRIRPVIPLHGGLREAIAKHYQGQT